MDLDGDGDLDMVTGSNYGNLGYFENTGNSNAPTFVQRFYDANPFHLLAIEYSSSPELVDLDGDGDLDVVVGEYSGRILFFRSSFSEIFADGFESGDTLVWSATVP